MKHLFVSCSSQRAFSLACVLGSLVLACASGFLPVVSGQAKKATTSFTLYTTSGKEARGQLHEIGKDWDVKIGKSNVKRRVLGGDILSIRQDDLPLPPLPADEHLVLVNGDRLPVQDLRLEDEKIYFKHPDLAGGKETSLPLSLVVLYWRSTPDRTASPEQFRRTLAREKRSKDVILFRNRDRLEGTLNAINGTTVEVEKNNKKTTAKLSQVAAIALNTELAEKPAVKGTVARVILTETSRSAGGRLTLVSASMMNDGTLRGKTVFGAFVRVPVARMASLDFAGSKIVPLSDLKMGKYTYQPYLDETWGWTIDATVTGREMRLGGSAYERGIGMHTSSTLTFRLEGGYNRFEAWLGLDDRDGRKGRVTVRVLGDGKEIDLGLKGPLTRASGVKRVSVSVEKVKELTLEVTGSPIQGVVNWAEARVVK